MVKVNQNNITLNGVALSDLNIDDLRFLEFDITEQIIIHGDQLTICKKNNLQTQIPFIENCLVADEQKREHIQAAIRVKYSGMQV